MSVEASQFTHSIKLEETAKGIRISVHVYGNNGWRTIVGAVDTYKSTQGLLQENNIPLAPMEVEVKKK